MKKPFAVLVAVFLFSFSAASFALMPSAVFSDSALGSFLLRSVGRTIVSSVLTAANDASWTSTFMSWLNAARPVGQVVVTSVSGVYELEITPSGNYPNNDLTYGAMSPGPPHYEMNFIMPSSVDSLGILRSHSVQGVTRSEVVDSMLIWWNPYAIASKKYMAQYAFGSISGPVGGETQTVIMTPLSGVVWSGIADVSLVDTPSDPNAGLHALWYIQTVSSAEVESADGIKRVRRSGVSWQPDLTDPDWSGAELVYVQELGLLDGVRFEQSMAGVYFDVYRTNSGVNLSVRQASSNAGKLLVSEAMLDAANVPVSVGMYEVVDIGSAVPVVPPAEVSGLFPLDYSRAGEEAAAGALLGEKIDNITSHLGGINTIASAVTATSVASDLDVLTVAEMSVFGDVFDGLRGWSLPVHSSVCPEPVIDLKWLNLGKHTLSVHCGVMGAIGSVLRSSMVAAFSLMAVFLVLSA